MKKKYPDKWRQVVARHMNGLARYLERKKSNGMSIETSFNWEPMLEDMDAAGMLKDVPEPREINWCVKHESIEYQNDYVCKDVINFSVERPCIFIKMREVEE